MRALLAAVPLTVVCAVKGGLCSAANRLSSIKAWAALVPGFRLPYCRFSDVMPQSLR